MLLNYDNKHPTVTSGVTQPLQSAAPSNISEPTSMEQKSVLITGCRRIGQVWHTLEATRLPGVATAPGGRCRIPDDSRF
jgi:hypothetical protein